MRSMPLDIGTLHFVGIGGIGMSGIAEVLQAMGYKVQGSDLSDSPNVKRLRDKGIEVFVGHDKKHIENAALVVVSSAIKNDNPELIAARENKLPIVRRAEMLAELMRLKWAIAIGGTHGKTTTTSLVGAMLEEGGFDPTVINGGIVNRYGTNTRLGKSDWMVVESDESDGTFTRLPAAVAVVTNIDAEHLEAYDGSFENLRKAYKRFIENVPFYGYAVLCIDHPEVQGLIPELTDRRVITYGKSAQADLRAENIRFSASGSTFDVHFSDQDEGIKDIYLAMPGEHNVMNALAALAIGREMGMSAAHMKKALAHFGGVKRRFTKTGAAGGISVIDDYGHHPVEIAAVLKTARNVVSSSSLSSLRKQGSGSHKGQTQPDSCVRRNDSPIGKVIAVMQPHRYSRLHDLFEEFCTCFNDADTVIIADVYAAGEAPLDGVGKESLADGIKRHGHRDVRVLESAEKLPQLVHETASDGDLVVCLGAGDITRWAQDLPAALEKLQAQGKKHRA